MHTEEVLQILARRGIETSPCKLNPIFTADNTKPGQLLRGKDHCFQFKNDKTNCEKQTVCVWSPVKHPDPNIDRQRAQQQLHDVKKSFLEHQKSVWGKGLAGEKNILGKFIH